MLNNNKKEVKQIIIFLIFTLLSGSAYFLYWYFYESNFEKTENAYINANQNIITSLVGGIVSDVNIVDGLQVEKEKVYIKLDATDFEIALEKSRNDLIKAIKNYKTLTLSKNQKEISTKIKIKELEQLTKDFFRDEKAFNSGVLSKEIFENTKLKYEQARANLDISNSDLKSTQNQLYAKNIKSHPDIENAIQNFRQAFIDLKRTSIYSSQKGVVAKKSIFVGQKVNPNQNIFSVVDLENEWVDANFKETQIKELKIGQKVILKSDVNDKEYLGMISFIGAGSGSALSLLPAQNATGNWIKIVQRVPVRIELDKDILKKNGVLPIGTSMRVEVIKKEIANIEVKINQYSNIINYEKEINNIVD